MKHIFSLILLCLPMLVSAQNLKTYIHPRAVLYIPTLLEEVDKIKPDSANRAYYPSLIEHETCITLKHSKCWSPHAELRNSREQGVGLGQLTRTWREDGSVRFDNLANMKRAHRDTLRELTWDNIKLRPDLQMRIIVLMVKESYNRYPGVRDPYIRYHFADVDYNGGPRDILKARQICGLAKGCDPQHWFDHVERYNPKPSKPDARYGGRSMRDINNHHARDVFFTRLPKYQSYIERLDREKQHTNAQNPSGA